MKVYERRALGKSAEALTVLDVSGLGAVGVNPEFSRAGIKIDSNALGWATNLDINGVEVSRLLVAETRFLLAPLVLVGSVSVGT